MKEFGLEHVLYRLSLEGGTEWFSFMETDFVDSIDLL